MKTTRVCLTTQEIEARLRAKSIQPTAQRIAICRFVLCEADHPTAEQVKEWADRNFPKMSLATVYNTLNSLVQAGLLKELSFPHLESTVFDSNTEAHHHFLDETTGQVYDLEPKALKVHVELGKDFQVNEVDVLVRGRLTHNRR